METPLRIFCAGGHAKQCIEIAELMGYSDIIVMDDNKTGNILGKRISRPSEVVDSADVDAAHYFIAVGDNMVRKTIYNRYPHLHYINLIHPQACISKYSVLGIGNYVGCATVILQDARVGSFNILNDLSCVAHDCRIGNFNHVSIHALMTGQSSIGDGNFLCGHAVIIPKISMGNWNILGASSTLLRPGESNQTWVGLPARPLQRPADSVDK
jgi:acetyltransferase EpsM